MTFRNTTLCYLEKDGAYLMLYRNKKENDENRGKWIGLGGKLEYGESPFDCARREIAEECGLIADRLRYRGIVTFVLGDTDTEYMHLFTVDRFHGTQASLCREGELAWIPCEQVLSLPLWEGDRCFLSLLAAGEERFFSLKLCYDAAGHLQEHVLEYAT